MSRDYAAGLVGQPFGDYRIEGVLGRGGMGAVLRGRDVKLDRDVALKIIGQEFGGQAGEAYAAARDRFLREAKTLAGLAHPNLIHLYAVGEVDGKHFFAMELVRGPTLAEWIQRFGPLREAAATRFCAQMLSALHSVHATGFVHRDIKPGNMMLDCSGALGGAVDTSRPILDQLSGDEAHSGRWVLMDFGLAKNAAESLDSSLTQQGLILGTPDTMSPEQAEGREVTRVSDLYSFGAVLFLALSGRLPFTAPSAMGVMQKHLMEPPPGLETFWREAPAVWREVTAKALAKKPAQRFQTEADMAAALLGRVEDLPELRELTRAQRRQPPGSAQTLPAAAVPIQPGVPVESTAVLSGDDVTRGAASARTVSSTAQTIRDMPAAPAPAAASTEKSAATTAATVDTGAVTRTAPPPPRKTGPRTGVKTGRKKPVAAATTAAAAKTALRNQPATPPRRRWLGILLGLVGLTLLALIFWHFIPPTAPPPPPVNLAPIPSNAFWGRDPHHPEKSVAIHWIGLDPTSQTYEVELYNAETKSWEEQSLTHDQMMQYGELKKPAADDAAFPRPPADAN